MAGGSRFELELRQEVDLGVRGTKGLDLERQDVVDGRSERRVLGHDRTITHSPNAAQKDTPCGPADGDHCGGYTVGTQTHQDASLLTRVIVRVDAYGQVGAVGNPHRVRRERIPASGRQ